MSQEDQAVSVRLRRNATSTPWGFRMQGGHEYGSPLFIQTVNPKSLSARQGLRVGDRLLAIAGADCGRMGHEQAKMEIIRAGNELDLIIQRRPGQTIDQPDARMPPTNNQIIRNDAYEEPTQYRGYTNPNVQSRSFKMLQESLSYSEANEEGMVHPTGGTPGESIVCRAYNEGRRRLEELSEINPRNYTGGYRSRQKFGNLSPKEEEELRLQEAMRKRVENPGAYVATAKKFGEVGSDAPATIPQVNLAGSSCLAPAGAQQQYLQQAKQHYQKEEPSVNGQAAEQVSQPQSAVVHQSQPRNKLFNVNYQFEEQYGHKSGQTAQVNNKQKAVVSPQKSNDFIPKTQTVSSVAEDLDLKHAGSEADPKQRPVVPTPQSTAPAHQSLVVSTAPAQLNVAAPPMAVTVQQSSAHVVNTDASDGAVIAKPASEPRVRKRRQRVQNEQPPAQSEHTNVQQTAPQEQKQPEPVAKTQEQVSIPTPQPAVQSESNSPSTPVSNALHQQICEPAPSGEVSEESVVAVAKVKKETLPEFLKDAPPAVPKTQPDETVEEPAAPSPQPEPAVEPEQPPAPEISEDAIVAEAKPKNVNVPDLEKTTDVAKEPECAPAPAAQEQASNAPQQVVIPQEPVKAEQEVVSQPEPVAELKQEIVPQPEVEQPKEAAVEAVVVAPEPAPQAGPEPEAVIVSVVADQPTEDSVVVAAVETPQPIGVAVTDSEPVEEVASFSITTDADFSIAATQDTEVSTDSAITIDFQADVQETSNDDSAVTVSLPSEPAKAEEVAPDTKKAEPKSDKPARAKFVDSQGGVAAS